MTKHNTEIALRQILAHAREAVNLLEGKRREDLDQDRVLNLALTRLLEIVGEAANRVPDEVQEQYPDLPWLQMRGVRNRLIHGYDSVDFDILWAIIKDDLPVLILQLEAILR
ncbi:MAG: HepT-like ribonuclease domain-containing protein [Chloroflexota bacterium]